MHALQLCLDLKINQNFKKIKENEIIYFLENDYIHIKNSNYHIVTYILHPCFIL